MLIPIFLQFFFFFFGLFFCVFLQKKIFNLISSLTTQYPQNNNLRRIYRRTEELKNLLLGVALMVSFAFFFSLVNSIVINIEGLRIGWGLASMDQ